MWTTNIVREIVRAEGFEPLPADRSVVDREIVAYGTQHVLENRPGVAVLKTHIGVPVLPRSVGIVTQRDVRDAFMSFMRFMRLPFGEALARYPQAALARPPERLYPGEPRLLLAYSAIVDTPDLAVAKIAEFLGAGQGLARSAEIAAKFSKAEVRTRIRAAEAEVRAEVQAGKKIGGQRLVVVSPTNFRVRDLETDFQSGHVSNYREGDWQRLLTPEQQAQLNALVAAAGHSLV